MSFISVHFSYLFGGDRERRIKMENLVRETKAYLNVRAFQDAAADQQSDFNGLFVEKQPHSRYTLHLMQRAEIQEGLIFTSKHRVHRINQKLMFNRSSCVFVIFLLSV